MLSLYLANNNDSNLEVVCHCCHSVRHLKYRVNKWVCCWSVLTDRAIVDEFDNKVRYDKNISESNL